MSDYVGKPILRYDGIGHVTARTTYVDDIQKPGMLYIKVLTSPVHKGIIRRLDVSAAAKMPGVAGVITAKDVPGTNAYGLIPDQPVFTPEKIRYKGERLAAVAAVDEDTAVEALGKIKLEIEEQTPVFDPYEAMKPGAPLVRPEGNVFQFDSGPTRKIRLGDVEKGFQEADYIIEGKYTNGMNDHAPMEPQVSVAYIDETDRLAIHTVSQDLYFHLGMLCGGLQPAHEQDPLHRRHRGRRFRGQERHPLRPCGRDHGPQDPQTGEVPPYPGGRDPLHDQAGSLVLRVQGRGEERRPDRRPPDQDAP